jgi:VWFA-related protein
VSLNVTVTDGSNHYVTDLAENDFSVFEDGVKQNITFFSRRQQPIALSLLLDSSASMEQHLPTLQTAATNFVRKLKPNDIAQVIDFDSRVEIRQAFTGIRPICRRPSSRPTPAARLAAQRDLHRARRSCVRSRPSAKKMCGGRR